LAFVLGVVAGFALVPGVAGASGGGGCGGPVTDESGTEVEIKEFCFTPTILRAEPGDTITFTNLSGGGDDDDDCEIDDLLPDDLTYISSTGGGTYDPATRTVTWTTGSVAAGQSKTFTLTAEVSDSAEIGSVLINRSYFHLLGIDVSPLGSATTMVVP